MSLKTALEDLRAANADLGEVVSELAMIVLDDRPAASEIAVVDNLGEIVSELQASVADARSELQRVTDVRQLPVRLPQIDLAVAACTTRYWRDLRSHGPAAELRAAARTRGVEWRTWQRSVEQSQLRCEEGIGRSSAAVRAAWQEVGELLSLYIPVAESPAAATAPEPPTLAHASATTMKTRRPS